MAGKEVFRALFGIISEHWLWRTWGTERKLCQGWHGSNWDFTYHCWAYLLLLHWL